VLRVKSIVTDRDSLALTGIPFPVVIPSTTTEYKWLGKLQGEPLLQINVNQLGLITQVRYLENPILGIDYEDSESSSVIILQNPVAGELNIAFNFEIGNASAHVFNSTGEKIITAGISRGEKQKSINIGNLADGIYFLRIVSDKNIFYSKFVVAR